MAMKNGLITRVVRPFARHWMVAVMLMVTPLFSAGQTFQALHDIDSSFDWAFNIFIQPDSNYFVIGNSSDTPTLQWQLLSAVISKDGSFVLNHHSLKLDSASIYTANAGEAEKLTGGGYACGLTIQRPRGNYLSSQAALVKLDSVGDTIFLKTYTDTSTYFDDIKALAVTPDGGFLLGGGHGVYAPTHFPGLIIRTDSNGNLLWVHTYQKIFSQNGHINSLEIFSDGRILVGASSSYQKYLPQSFTYFHDNPWFLLLDSVGNVLRDTLIENQYQGKVISSDKNGGYFHWGYLDTLITSDAYDHENFPSYLAHLDSNFEVDWRIVFPYSLFYGQREPWSVRLLSDHSYLITGAMANAVVGNPICWTAKVSSSGTLLWNHIFISDSSKHGYFTMSAERDDGSLILAGMNGNDSLPIWHTNEDIWLVSVDSNGCLISECSPDTADPNATGVPLVLQEAGIFSLYPNPTTGSFSVNTAEEGEFVIYSMDGRIVAKRQVNVGVNNIQMPGNAAGGLYLGVFKRDPSRMTRQIKEPHVVRIIYEP
jgi:hypothetical protein